MLMDENDYFRQATIRICSSLDLKVALQDYLRYLENFMPISRMDLSLYEPRAGTLRNLAHVTPDKIKQPLPPVFLSKKAMATIEADYNKNQNVYILDRPELHPVCRAIFERSGETSNKSIMVMHLPLERDKKYVLVLTTEGKGNHTEFHAKLLSVLQEPFTIAISNSVRYQEVLKLKELLDAENWKLRKKLTHSSSDKIIGANLGLKGVMEMVEQVAFLDSPVMLLGETGVGKEIIADYIHYSSPRKDKPFIKVNCGAIPEGLLDSELFGHEKGAFTSAIAQKPGRFERAHTGSIFLDELGDLPPAAQVKLLRVIEKKEIERIGGTISIPADARIITATHRNLEEMVSTGRFREDLWFRLNIFPIMIPPLRQRKEDIPALVDHFVEKKSRELKLHTPPPFTPESIESLKSHDWPGNIRELENLVERALIQHRSLNESLPLNFEHFVFPRETSSSRFLPHQPDAILPLDKATTAHIQEALALTNGRIYGPDGAAHLLGINPNTLRSKMKKLGILLTRNKRLPKG